jgi:hypothetical protein
MTVRSTLGIVLANAVLLGLWAAGLAPDIAAENGIIETLQLLLAAGVFSIFLFTALSDQGPIGSAGAATAAIVGIAIVREIDVRNVAIPHDMLRGAGRIRDAAIGIMLVLVIGYAWARREHFRGWVNLLFRWRAWPYWASGILLTASIAFDGGKIINGPVGVLIEEFIEFNGFLLLFIAGLRHAQLLIAHGQIEP